MSKNLASEKYLVVEQKGWRWVLLGLSIAFLFSLTFKAIFSPRRIQYEIERALSGADPRISSSIEGASLSLADGFLPRLAIVIEKFSVQTNDPCLFGAKATIQNLVLPVAFSSLLDRTLVFKRIEVGLLALEMRARRESCGDQSQAIPSIPSVATPESSTATASDGVAANSLERPPLVQTMSVESSLLRNLIFKEVHLQFVEWPLFHWNLKGVEVQLPVKGEDHTHIEGLVTLTSDQQRFPFQGLHARLELDSDAEKATAKIRGAWREGRVDVEGQWYPHRKDFLWKGSFKQIPWSQLIVLAQVLGRTGPMPTSSQAWVSADVLWSHDAIAPEKIEVSEGHIEGEFGDFILGKVIAQKETNATQWSVEPYKALAKEVDLDILTRMLGWSEPPPAFDRLGIFDGEGQFTNNQLISMSGQWRGLQVIFSNRGLREHQSIKTMTLDMAGGSNQWSGYIRKIELENGDWKGDVSMALNQNEKTVELESDFSNFKLSPEVEELMTIGGSLGSLEGRLSLKIVDGVTNDLNGFLKFEKSVIAGVVLDKLKLDFSGNKGFVNGRVQAAGIDWPISETQFLPKILPEGSERALVKNISGQFNRSPESMAISGLQGLLVESKSRLSFDGGWRQDSAVYGMLQVRGERKSQIFDLKGTRQVPLWEVRK
ncbi:MAG: hypothetical protein RJB66_1935 [Pseudomonadota bacterium]|jgi:hypothetical protein